MGIEGKLRHWRESGLIDAETERRILAHESQRGRPLLLYSVGGLGALAIAIGLVAVVASNWAELGRGAKLAGDALLGLALATAVYRLRDAAPLRAWLRESAVVLFYGWTLASMALVGQIYHLSAPTWRTLLVWNTATFLVVWQGRGRVLAALWWSAWVATTWFGAAAWVETFRDYDEDATAIQLGTLCVGLGPLLFLVLARLGPVRRARPAFSGTWTLLTWVLLLVVGGGAQLYWNSVSRDEPLPVLALAGSLAAASAFAWALPRLHPDLPPRSIAAGRVVLLVVYVLGALPFLFERDAVPFAAALSNLVLLGVLAWAALRLGSPRAFHAVTGLIALRLLVIYLEVFGSLLQTGLGLIVGGVLTLALAWLWLRRAPRWARLLEGREGSDAT